MRIIGSIVGDGDISTGEIELGLGSAYSADDLRSSISDLDPRDTKQAREIVRHYERYLEANTPFQDTLPSKIRIARSTLSRS